jgi:L-cysteine desulfidase
VRFTNTFVITAVSVPEPGTVGLLTAALLGLLALSQTTRANAKRRPSR